jgi:hypothetical protein
MFVQNGSAIFVAVLAEQTFDELWVTPLSFAFTIAYFVVVEAMSKTFGICTAPVSRSPSRRWCGPSAGRSGCRPLC